MYQSVTHVVVAQNELGRGMRQGGQESVICFLEQVQEVFSQAYGPQARWSAFHRTKLVEAVVKGVSSRKQILLRRTKSMFPFRSYTSGILWFSLRSAFRNFIRR